MAEPDYDPFSPAGTVERFGDLSRGLSHRRWGKVAVWVALGLFVGIPVIASLAILLVHHH